MSLTATLNPELARVELTFDGAPAVTGLPVYLERSTNGGTRWEPVRGAYPLRTGSGAGTGLDYEYTPGIVNDYRARTAIVADSFTRTVTDSWGTADTGQAWSATPTADADVTGAAGTLTVSQAPTGTSRTVIDSVLWQEFDVRAAVSIDRITTGPAGRGVNASLQARRVSFADYYGAEVEFQPDATIQLSLRGLEQAILVDTATGIPYTPGQRINTRLRVKNKRVQAKVWTGATEPSRWLLEATDDAVTSAGGVSCFCFRDDDNADSDPVITWEDVIAEDIRDDPTTRLFTLVGADQVTPTQAQTWLKVPTRPYLNQVLAVNQWSEVARPARGGLFPVLGRRDPIAVTEVRGSRRFDLTVGPLATDDADALTLALSFGDVILLAPTETSEVPGPLYAFVDDVTVARLDRSGSSRRWVTVALTESAPPDPSIAGDTITWTGVTSAYPTWGGVVAAQSTWLDLVSAISDPQDEIVG